MLAGAGAPYRAGFPEADRLVVARPTPEVDSIEPLFARPGDTVNLRVRGRSLQDAGTISFVPESNLAASNQSSVNSDGTELSTVVTVGVLASAGPRVLQVSTPGGRSAAEASPANTFTIVEKLQGDVSPIASGLLGVVRETAAEAGTKAIRTDSASVGLALGPAVQRVEPQSGAIGTSMNLEVFGSELTGTDEAQFSPPDGLTVGTPNVDADGRRMVIGLSIAADAPQTVRRLSVKAGGRALPTAASEAATFSVTAPLPALDSISPIYVVTGDAPVTLTLRGRNLQNAAFVRAVPASGLSLGWPPTVNAAGTEATVTMAAAGDATPGPRAVALETPAGGTGVLATDINTLTVLAQPPKYSVAPLAALPVGILKNSASPPASQDIALASPTLGLVLPSSSPSQSSQAGAAYSPVLGLAIGPVATELTQPYLTPDTSSTLTVHGWNLGAVASAIAVGPSGVALGVPTVSASGETVSLPVTVASSAAAGTRQITLRDAAARPVPFADPSRAAFTVAAGQPRIDSIEPILAKQGDTVSLTIRGANLTGGRIAAEPATGLAFVAAATANAAGTELTAGFVVSSDAPLGARVLRVETAGGITAGAAAPANTFTVFPQ